jgi:LmbE family N-acetylglucosaminyl deacetylase/SAM-dependent methyltransferase
MTLSLDVDAHLKEEIGSADPWRLNSNPFEQKRYEAMLAMARARGRFGRGLEVGCAAGAFTDQLAPLCDRLHVIDVLPEAIDLASQRLNAHRNVTWEVASVVADFAPGESFDLIVVAEVLCYLPDRATLRAAIERLAGRLNEGGLLIFSSAVDAACAKWGLLFGAETAAVEWERVLRETNRIACKGAYWGEDCRIVSYAPLREAVDNQPAAFAPEEHKLTPYQAHTEIPARSVLVLAPHPDDEALGCGGAISRHVQLGVPVRVAIVTDGAFGMRGTARADEARRREAESCAAAKVLGYGEPSFWGMADHGVAYGEPLVARIMDAAADTDLIYAPSPFEMHPDHRALGMAAMEAVRRLGAGVRLALYEVGVPLKPNLLLDITALAATKQAAVRCYKSQLNVQAYDEQIAALNRFRTYTLPGSVKAAEAFLMVSGEELERDPIALFRSEHERQRGLGFALAPSDLPLVSVIVRSVDRPELDDALDSVALQTYPNIEVVVVGASASHRPLPDVCGRSSLRLIHSGRKLSRSEAANVGLDNAGGEFVIFLDDDDLFMPSHLARLVRTIQERPGTKVAYAGVRVEEGERIVDTYDASVSPSRLLAWNHLPIHAVMFDRSLCLEGARFDESLDLYEDWDFWLELSERCEFVRAEGVSAIYRADLGRSRSGGVTEGCQRKARLQVWRKWLKRRRPEDFEALVSDFRERTEEDERRLADARYTEGVLRTMVSDLQQRLRETEHAEAILAATRASSSWRITAPLRKLTTLTRRLLGRGPAA